MPYSNLLTRNDLQNVLAHINLGDDAHMEITQAEFDQLSDEDKNDGTIYFISDGMSKNVFLDDNMPIGAIVPYGGMTDPAYWLICDGRAVSRTIYAELFTVIGTTYGSGDGETTFNIPDLRGRVAIGESNSYTLGSSGGEASHTLSVDETPSHTHAYSKPVLKWGTLSETNGTLTSVQVPLTTNTNTSGGIFSDRFSDSYYRGVANTGGGQPHNNMQPYIVTNYIIKTTSAMSKQQSQLDCFYPIGARFQTSNSAFNPATYWGGIWELENDYELVAWIAVDNNTVVASKNLSASGLGETTYYTLTFDKPLIDNKYIVTVSAEGSGAGAEILGIYGKTVTQFLFDHTNYSGTQVAIPIFSISVFGRLAEPENYKWHRIA